MAPTVTYDLSSFDLQDNDRSIDLKNFNLEVLNAKYEKSPTNSISVHKLFLSEGNCTPKVFRMKFDGRICTPGINGRDFGSGKTKKTVFSLGIIPDDKVLETFSLLEENTCASTAPDFELTSIIKNDRMYLKLKLDGKQFQAKSNIPLSPKKNGCGVSYGDSVTVIAEASLYVNIAESKVGITLNVMKLDFAVAEVDDDEE